MSWLARSIAATLSSSHSDEDGDDLEASSGDDHRDEQPDTPSGGGGGVKGDLSELTDSLTRGLWGVASFLAPPPAPAAEAAETATGAVGEGEGEDGARSPRIAGIRSDLAEIGGRVRSGISLLSNANAVAEISKIASSLLPFGPGEDDDDDDDAEAVGVTEEVVEFVRHISTHPETWLDFPLFVNDRHADDFELSDTQYGHALAIERVVPSLSYLRTELCSTNMSEACFWKIYFVLLHSKLSKQDAELLSTPQILKAREVLLQSSPTKKRLGPDDGSSQNWNVASTKGDNSGMSEAPSLEEATSVPMNVVEADKHPISVAEVEIIDKSVVEEELVVKNETKSIPSDSEKANLHITSDDDDKEVEDWLKDVAPVSSKTGNVNSAGQEEDISFSDLEDREDD
uniref:BSD domain-containing protein n=1 Tax=Oryza glumipatula TaxID=40148 RepID=A0A0D9YFE8_9ORYZ